MLNLAFEKGNVKFERPKSDTSKDGSEWFSILLVHQNKFKGMHAGTSKRESISENIFPNFINLVIWGHEHECITEPHLNSENGVVFLYPGSTVATSLSDFESKPKHCFVLQIQRVKFNITPIPLEKVRPFFFKNIYLADYISGGVTPNDALEEIIHKILQEHIGIMLPLVRLKVNQFSRLTIQDVIFLRYQA